MIKNILIAIGVIILTFLAWAIWYWNQQIWGAVPIGERLKRIEASPNYRDGKWPIQ